MFSYPNKERKHSWIDKLIAIYRTPPAEAEIELPSQESAGPSGFNNAAPDRQVENGIGAEGCKVRWDSGESANSKTSTVWATTSSGIPAVHNESQVAIEIVGESESITASVPARDHDSVVIQVDGNDETSAGEVPDNIPPTRRWEPCTKNRLGWGGGRGKLSGGITEGLILGGILLGAFAFQSDEEIECVSEEVEIFEDCEEGDIPDTTVGGVANICVIHSDQDGTNIEKIVSIEVGEVRGVREEDEKTEAKEEHMVKMEDSDSRKNGNHAEERSHGNGKRGKDEGGTLEGGRGGKRQKEDVAATLVNRHQDQSSNISSDRPVSGDSKIRVNIFGYPVDEEEREHTEDGFWDSIEDVSAYRILDRYGYLTNGGTRYVGYSNPEEAIGGNPHGEDVAKCCEDTDDARRVIVEEGVGDRDEEEIMDRDEKGIMDRDEEGMGRGWEDRVPDGIVLGWDSAAKVGGTCGGRGGHGGDSVILGTAGGIPGGKVVIPGHECGIPCGKGGCYSSNNRKPEAIDGDVDEGGNPGRESGGGCGEGGNFSRNSSDPAVNGGDANGTVGDSAGDGGSAVGDGDGAVLDGDRAAVDGGGAVGDGEGAVGNGDDADGDGGGAVGDRGGADGDGGSAVGDGDGAVGDGGSAVGDGGNAVGDGGSAVGDGGHAGESSCPGGESMDPADDDVSGNDGCNPLENASERELDVTRGPSRFLERYYELMYIFGVNAHLPRKGPGAESWCCLILHMLQKVAFAIVSSTSGLQSLGLGKMSFISVLSQQAYNAFVDLAFNIASFLTKLYIVYMMVFKKEKTDRMLMSVAAYEREYNHCTEAKGRKTSWKLWLVTLLAVSTVATAGTITFAGGDVNNLEKLVLKSSYKLSLEMFVWTSQNTTETYAALKENYGKNQTLITTMMGIFVTVRDTASYLHVGMIFDLVVLVILVMFVLLIAFMREVRAVTPNVPRHNIEEWNRLQARRESLWIRYRQLREVYAAVNEVFDPLFKLLHLGNLLRYAVFMTLIIFRNTPGAVLCIYAINLVKAEIGYFISGYIAEQNEAICAWIRNWGLYTGKIKVGDEEMDVGIILHELEKNPMGIGKGKFLVNKTFHYKFLALVISTFFSMADEE